MKPENDLTQSGQPRRAETPAPPRRFRIDKLEERIAPKRGGNGTKNCPLLTGSCDPRCNSDRCS